MCLGLNRGSVPPAASRSSPRHPVSLDPTARSVHLRIFVDTQSVEVFVNAGHTMLSQQVHFADGDTGISLHADGGPATFSRITIRSFE